MEDVDVTTKTHGLTQRENEFRNALYNAAKQNNDIWRLSQQIIPPFGIVLNALFLLVVFRVTSMRTIINVYLSNLAVADTGYLIVAMSRGMDTSSWNPDISEVVGALASSLNVASYCFVTTVALERLSAVRHPIRFRASSSKTRAAKISAGLWAFAVVLWLILTIVIITIPDNTKTVMIALGWSLLAIFIITFAVTFISYVCMFHKLRHPTDPANVQNNKRRTQKVVTMLAINTIVFFLLNSAVITLVVMVAVVSTGRGLGSIEYASACLGVETAVFILRLINCSTNTLLYTITNGDYRAAVVETLSWPCRTRSCRRAESAPARPRVACEQVELAIVRPVPPSESSPKPAEDHLRPLEEEEAFVDSPPPGALQEP